MKFRQLLFALVFAALASYQQNSFAASASVSANMAFADSGVVSVDTETEEDEETTSTGVNQNSNEWAYSQYIISQIGVFGSISQAYQISANCSLSSLCSSSLFGIRNKFGIIEPASGASGQLEVSSSDINGNTGIKQIRLKEKNNYNIDVLVVYL